jgi:hypothetical protein
MMVTPVQSCLKGELHMACRSSELAALILPEIRLHYDASVESLNDLVTSAIQHHRADGIDGPDLLAAVVIEVRQSAGQRGHVRCDRRGFARIVSGQ